MSRLGSAKLAKQAADSRGATPEGWQNVGSGAFRKVFLGPDGVCYKRTHSGDPFHNKREWENYRELRTSQPKGVKLPRMRYFPSCGVLATEYVQGLTGDDLISNPEANEVFMSARRALAAEGFYDVHHYNFVVKGPEAYYIDLGERRGRVAA